MKKTLIPLLAIIIFALPFASCSDDDDNPTNGSSSDTFDYFPMTMGSWWKYENHVLDSNASPVGEAEFDSVAITNDAVEILNKTAFEYTTWDLVDGNAEEPVKDYFYMDGDKLYAYSDLIGRQMDLGTELPIPIEIDEMWIKVADPAASSWQIIQQQMDGVQIDVGVPVTFDGTFTITCDKKELSTTEVDGTGLKTQRYEILSVIEGVITTLLGTNNFLIETSYSVWYADGVGIVRAEMKPFKATASGLFDMPFEGSRSVLTDHNVPQAVK